MKIKRLFDLACFFFASMVFSPFFILISAAILLDDGRPLFFRQERVGRGRRPFMILKFRTMRDGQVTRAGAALRRTGLDELPQFLNILLGDMSFVGPRPLTQADIARLGWANSRSDFRWRLRPGITGFAQIFAGTGAAESLARRSLVRDRFYLGHRSVLWDMKILVITFAMNFLGKARVKRWMIGYRGSQA